MYPPAVLAALNLKVEIFFTIYGFFSYFLTFGWLIASVQAMNLGVSIVSKEVAGKTADFLLTKPITRARMLTEKLAAITTLILITNVAYLATAIVSALTFSKDKVELGIFFPIAATLFFIQIFFLALGFLFGSVLPKVKTVVAVTLPTVFTFFIISAFGSALKLTDTSYFTPYKYFDAIYIYNHSAYEPRYLWLLLCVIVVCIFTSFIVYLRKDIEAAN